MRVWVNGQTGIGAAERDDWVIRVCGLLRIANLMTMQIPKMRNGFVGIPVSKLRIYFFFVVGTQTNNQ